MLTVIYHEAATKLIIIDFNKPSREKVSSETGPMQTAFVRDVFQGTTKQVK